MPSHNFINFQTDCMLTIDIHTHIIPEHLPDFSKKFGYGDFIHLEHHKPCCARMMRGDIFFREIEENCWSDKKRLEDCELHKVDVQVLSTIPILFNYWAKPEDCLEVSRFLNDHIAGIVQNHPKRFVGLGTIPLQDPELSIGEIERCKKIGLAGIEIGSHINKWNLNAPELFPVFETCARLNMCVFVHPWAMMGRKQMQQYWLPWLVGMPAETSLAVCSMIFGGVFERLPDLRVAFAHGGGSFPATIGRIEHGFLQRPDLVAIDNKLNPRNYLGKFWVDSLTHDAAMLDYIVKLIGADKVALGSDYPFPLGETVPGELILSTDYPKNIKEKLLSGAALAWLNRKREEFA
jgi:aminocarboxymuconate-semialdehyde decarboxylase